MLLLSINQQSLIATKANRLVRAAHGTAVAEFGTRRAQGVDEAVYGARAAYIGGCVATSGVIPEKEFGIPSVNTMIHSGIPNAIKAFDDVLAPLGKRPKSVRIDSGDITYLSKRVRKMLDVAGYPDCDIMASNSLDEHLISDMVSQGAKVDCFIVGERLITSASSPLFGGVYKLSAIEKDGKTVPKINLSENVRKITIPSSKQVYRLIDKDSGKAIADVLTLDDEIIDETKPFVLFDPDFTWKRKEIENFVTRKLLVPIFEGGKKVYEEPSLKEIREYCLRQTDTLWDEVKRFENPHKYYVDLSKNLWAERNGLIEKFKGIK